MNLCHRWVRRDENESRSLTLSCHQHRMFDQATAAPVSGTAADGD